MKKTYHTKMTPQKREFDRFVDVNSSIDLPALDEFSCTYEELREVCVEFENFEPFNAVQ